MKIMKKLCQATLTLVLMLSMVLSTGIKSAYADVLSNEYNTAMQEQTEFAELLYANMYEYEGALDLLANAEELDAEHIATINDCIDYILASGNVTAEDTENLNAFKDLLVQADELNNAYNAIANEEEKTQYTYELSGHLSALATSYGVDSLNKFISTIITVIPDVGLREARDNASSAELFQLEVNGLPLDVNKLTDTVYVGYEVVDLEVIAQPMNTVTTKVEVIKPEQLVVGNNEVRIIVTALNGEVKEYVINVIRLDQEGAQGDGVDAKTAQTLANTVESTPEEVKVSTLSKSYSKEDKTTDKKEEKKKKEVKEFDEEVEESKGLNGLTILLIVAGIALIGFGIYMLFGDKDDEIPTVKKVNPKKTNAKANNNKTVKTKKINKNKR